MFWVTPEAVDEDDAVGRLVREVLNLGVVSYSNLDSLPASYSSLRPSATILLGSFEGVEVGIGGEA